jgi:hypothetical protein
MQRQAARPVRATLTVLLACACLPVAAHAATQSVRLHATLTPEHLGQGTTVGFGFEIVAPHGQIPSPLTALDVNYPGDLGIALSGLGLATCSQARLEVAGPKGCPANSVMGYGTALAEIPVGPAILSETATITIVRALVGDGHFTLLFYADAHTPVLAQIAFPGVLLPAPRPFGGRIAIGIPLVPSLPEGPDVAIVQLHSTLGPQHVIYYERVHGGTVAYHPKGIALPNSCPHRGFPFAATFTFLDGTKVTARTAVRCPRTP